VNTQGDVAPPKGAKRYVPIALVVVGIVLFVATGAHEYLSFEALSRHRADLLQYAEAHAIAAVLLFMLAYVVVVALSLPGGVWLTLAGGFVFGGWAAGLYVVFSATVGATLIFLAARYAFADLFRARVLSGAGPALAKMEAGFRKNAFNYCEGAALGAVVSVLVGEFGAGIVGCALVHLCGRNVFRHHSRHLCLRPRRRRLGGGVRKRTAAGFGRDLSARRAGADSRPRGLIAGAHRLSKI